MDTILNSSKSKLSEMSLDLVVHDEDVLKYLSEYEGPQREEKALEALKIGVIAILSASPSLDTKVVEGKFNDIEKQLEKYTKEFKDYLMADLKKYFEKEKGDIPLTFNSFLGEQGILSGLLNKYFDPEEGKINTLLQNELGSGSVFAKSLDPANKESVISRIEDKVKNELSKVVEDLTGQFSLDKEDSGMSRVKKIFEVKVAEIKDQQDKFFSEIRTHLKMEEARAQEAEKGTQKGRNFETILYEKIALLGQQLQDLSENVTGTIGETPRSKVGDYIITLGNTSGAPGKRMVIEVKKEQNYKERDVIEELKQAKENRKADCGIFVFAKGYEPVEIGDFKINGNDFFCTVDEESLQQGEPIIFLEAAYKIARIYIISQLRKETKGEVDLSMVKGNIQKMLVQVNLMSDLLTKAKTIQTSGEIIEKTAKTIKEELEAIIQSTLGLLK